MWSLCGERYSAFWMMHSINSQGNYSVFLHAGATVRVEKKDNWFITITVTVTIIIILFQKEKWYGKCTKRKNVLASTRIKYIFYFRLRDRSLHFDIFLLSKIDVEKKLSHVLFLNTLPPRFIIPPFSIPPTIIYHFISSLLQSCKYISFL